MTENASDPNLATDIVKVCHLSGEFRLRSGIISNEYFDKYQIESNPELLKRTAHQLTRLIPSDTELLAGLELGGVPLATALSLLTGLPAVFVRKQAKTYGTAKLAEGPSVVHRRLCVVEDVVSTGGQALESIELLRNLGAQVSTLICVIFRGEASPTVFADHHVEFKYLFQKSKDASAPLQPGCV